ncbi:MAG: NifB/NifX family molybdenum-iron cluster-binding protein [Armatimonadetes bacterium]|nr:NifB/NifX family molybdenum-iron cluster-binding protein [Armatimonadota bacterium]
MKIAIPTANGLLCPHFGHTDEFTIVDVDPKNNEIVNTQTIPAPEHEPGLLPRWLHEMGVTVVIAGGMGVRAQSLFSQNGIRVCVGAPVALPADIVAAYLDGTLETGANPCDH